MARAAKVLPAGDDLVNSLHRSLPVAPSRERICSLLQGAAVPRPATFAAGCSVIIIDGMTATDDHAGSADVSLADFQQLIRDMYLEKDIARGVEGTFMWLISEVGELAESLRQRDQAAMVGEFADVLAWLTTIANIVGVDLTDAVTQKYGRGCPGCGQLVCRCADAGKP